MANNTTRLIFGLDTVGDSQVITMPCGRSMCLMPYDGNDRRRQNHLVLLLPRDVQVDRLSTFVDAGSVTVASVHDVLEEWNEFDERDGETCLQELFEELLR